ncbi:MAG: phage minor head protein, partial [Steroidobacteraceae bacterium]
TLQEFRRDFDTIVERHGWAYNGTPGWRSRIIYETNLSSAYSAGRYAQLTDPSTLAVFPYWTYNHGDSVHPRPMHLSWNGITLHADDPWWDTHYTPNGWRCSCYITATSRRGLARMGKSVPDTAPALDAVPWRNPHTGTVHMVPKGIDPGFDYNPGKAWLHGGQEMPVRTAPLRPMDPRDATDVAQPDALDFGALLDELRRGRPPESGNGDGS